MMKTKGFLMIESLIALMITLIALTAFTTMILDSRQFEKKIEYRSDRALANYMLNEFKLKEVVVHDHVFRE